MGEASCNRRPNLVQDRQIGPSQFQDFGRVGAVWTRALEVGLAAEIVRQRPPHSIDDKPALDSEDDVPEERHPAQGPDATSHPSGGGRVGFEKARERSPALPRVDVKRPARDVTDHRLGREFVALDPGGLGGSQDRSATSGHSISPVRRNPSRATSTIECGQPASQR